MIGPKGDEVREGEHEVKSIGKAKYWWIGCEEHHLPVRVRQYKALDGRVRIEIFDCGGRRLHTRG